MNPREIVFTLAGLFSFCSVLVIVTAWLFPNDQQVMAFFTSSGSAFFGAITTYIQMKRKEESSGDK
jgi:hypothetical protein